MFIIRKLLRKLSPNSKRADFTTEKIKTSRCTIIRRKKNRPSAVDKYIAQISFIIAAICIFEATLWATSGWAAPLNLQSRIQIHQSSASQTPFDISIVIHQSLSCLISFLLISFRLKTEQNKHLSDDNESNKHKIYQNINQSSFDRVVLTFLVTLSSAKKGNRWIQ